MAKEKNYAPTFDDIVFEKRNKEYGAYRLRKKYNRNLLIGMLIGTVIIATAVIGPYINAKAQENRAKKQERQVQLQMENLDQPQENIAPPPPPPPPPAESVAQVRYVPPVVVDSIKPEDANKQLMTADQAQTEVKNTEVTVQETVQEEVKEEEAPTEVFVVVEEMPQFPGGEKSLLDYVYSNIQYPEIAKENNLQGRVILRFCVTYKGGVDQVSVIKGVDPSLDNEAIRVVKTLPPWKPGKQGGKPVNVWYSLPIVFQLK
ncbi:MAG TPA: energy transducer TonB [Bacteroidales bacterium]|nr:energy transducer TonB [Bacteroidales bacterium]